MESTGTCPRGHAVASDAVLCTVCWVRLDGEDPIRKRARILNLVSQPVTAFAVGAMVLVIGVGVALVTTGQSAPASVVAAAATATGPSSQPTPSTEDAPVVTAVPLAATIVDPLLSGAPGTCLLTAGEQQIDCRLEGDSVRFDVCLPAAAATLELRTRATADDPWQDVPANVVLLSGGACEARGLRADVAIEAAVFFVSDDRWRLVARDDAQGKVWSSKLRPATPQG